MHYSTRVTTVFKAITDVKCLDGKAMSPVDQEDDHIGTGWRQSQNIRTREKDTSEQVKLTRSFASITQAPRIERE